MEIHLIDNNKKSLETIKSNKMPFMEFGANKVLNKSLKNKLFYFETDLKNLSASKFIIICIGTPVNSKLKPNLKDFFNLIFKLKKYVKKDQLIIVRSSVYPGTIEKIKKILKTKNKNIVYCPERIVQSKSLIELPKLPQIIASDKAKIFMETKNYLKK